ncbi:MAG: DUF5324 family protein [Propionibacteriaceae bacterium]|nr:DUF5324 family protein [Micropruina sp.]HBX80322.1 hypothetical protein [Propionibacteriaceae bacterium]HBY21772.1 hypothetical protein [Propionibacteriaceae bacterium]
MKKKKVLTDAQAALDHAGEFVAPYVDQAYTAAKPYLDQAHTAAKPYLDQAQPYVEQAVKASSHYAQEAARAAKPYLDQAKPYLDQAQPYVDQALRTGTHYAHEAQRLATPYVDQAMKSGTRYFDNAARVLIPMAHELFVKGAEWGARHLDNWEPHIHHALDQVTPTVEQTINRLQPVIEDALQRVAPAVDAARGRVQEEFIPKFSEALHSAANHPVAQEAQRRLSLATQALAGELETHTEPVVLVATVEVAKPKRGFFRTAGKVVAAGAVLAGVVVAVRKLLGPSDAGWEAHQPSAAYVADPVADIVEHLEPTTPPAEASPVTVADDAPAAGPDAPAYGEGSYVGATPPEGFDIKGNANSMKYHLPGGQHYERTIAEVWFDSEGAAEAAGFVKAQR